VSLILSWVLFPLVLAAVGAGWGALVERAAGVRAGGALLIPLGLAAVIVVAGLLTAFEPTARAAVPVAAAGAVVGLALARRRLPLEGWPLLAALGALLAYGAPVLLSGSATFLGYIRLDDTATWLNIVDHVMSHARSVSAELPSTYTVTFTGDVGPTYPLGAFMLIGVGHALTGIDSAWIVQSYLACCGAAIALCAYAMLEPLVSSPRIRALVAFFAAQPALLYGYSLWGGDKELTAAFLLILGAALLSRVIAERPANPRGLLPLAVATAALIQVLGVGAAAFVVPALIALLAVWARRTARGERKTLARDLGLMSATTAVLALPVWLTVSEFLGERAHGLFSSGTHTAEESFGNLIQPLSGWQLAGIWPIGDFRLRAPTVASVLLIGFALIAAAAAIWITVRRRQFTIVAYVAVALIGCAIFYLIGSTPWVVGKALAISSPALLLAALAGGALLWARHPAGIIVVLVIGGGVVWSNVLGYHGALLAPRARLAELQHIGTLLAGKGPTFLNDYEIYGDRHFLRAGAPVAPAEYRPVTLPLTDGAILTKSAYADLDSFPLSTLEPYRSIVTTRAPIESRPPSMYALVWQGRYYELWQRPAEPTSKILMHLPFGDTSQLPFCGNAEGSATRSLCSIAPATVPPCRRIESFARFARRHNAELVAYQRPEPVVIRGDQLVWPGAWFHEPATHSLTATSPGTAVAHIALNSSQRYELWLGGGFARGLEVSVDGHHVARVKDQLANIGDYTPVADLFLEAGVHTVELTYPHSDLTPGSGDNGFTTLTAIALEPLERPPSELLTASPRQAKTLCGRPLDWIEAVAPST
jgi:hypothetical protein